MSSSSRTQIVSVQEVTDVKFLLTCVNINLHVLTLGIKSFRVAGQNNEKIPSLRPTIFTALLRNTCNLRRPADENFQFHLRFFFKFCQFCISVAPIAFLLAGKNAWTNTSAENWLRSTLFAEYIWNILCTNLKIQLGSFYLLRPTFLIQLNYVMYQVKMPAWFFLQLPPTYSMKSCREKQWSQWSLWLIHSWLLFSKPISVKVKLWADADVKTVNCFQAINRFFQVWVKLCSWFEKSNGFQNLP